MMSNRERDTVLAALLAAAACHGEDVGDELREVETNGGKHEGLTDAEIDELCERINIDMDEPSPDKLALEKLRMVAKVMRDALDTAESFMSGFEDDNGEGFMDEADLAAVRAAIDLHDMQKLPAEPENVRRFLDISTAHLLPTTRHMIEEKTVIGPIYDYPDGFGWLVYVPDPQRVAEWEGPDPIPADLIACFDKARELRCDYILFDCDAMELDGLPLYDDDGKLIEDDYVESGEAAHDAREAANRAGC
jgi:hypothetical protein